MTTNVETIESIVPSFRLDDRIAVITGGAGGLAVTLSKALLSQGAHIALVDLTEEIVQPAVKELIAWGEAQKITPLPKVSGYSCDVSKADVVEEVVQKIKDFYGTPADLLIHTAGYCQNFPALEYPAQKATDLVNVNLLGSYFIAKSVAKALVDANKPGSMILVASMSGVIVNDPQPQVAYNMAKAGVIHLVKSLACEWSKHNIRVNCLSPGYILTQLTRNVLAGNPELKKTWESKVPMHRMAEPKEFIGSVLYLASQSASSYTTGENLIVDGGYQCW